MSSVTGRGEHAWWLAGAVCGLIGYQVLADRALAQGAAGSWVALVPLLAAVVLTWRTRLRWPLVALAAAAGIWLWTRPAGVAGALLGGGILYATAFLYEKIRGAEGMGGGDRGIGKASRSCQTNGRKGTNCPPSQSGETDYTGTY